MEELYLKRRRDILDKDKNVSKEILRRVLKQADIESNTIATQENAVDNVIESEADRLYEALVLILETKLFYLEQHNKKNVPTNSLSKEVNIKQLALTSEFASAYNKLARFYTKKGLDVNAIDYVNRLFTKLEEYLNPVCYGYQRILEHNSKTPTGKETEMQSILNQIFKSYALFKFCLYQIQNKQVRPINDNELLVYSNNLFDELPAPQKTMIELKTKKSIFREEVSRGYKDALDERKKEYKAKFNRDMSPDEIQTFKNLYLGLDKINASTRGSITEKSLRSDKFKFFLLAKNIRKSFEDFYNTNQAAFTVPTNLSQLKTDYLDEILAEYYKDIPDDDPEEKQRLIDAYSKQIDEIIAEEQRRTQLNTIKAQYFNKANFKNAFADFFNRHMAVYQNPNIARAVKKDLRAQFLKEMIDSYYFDTQEQRNATTTNRLDGFINNEYPFEFADYKKRGLIP